MRRASGKAGACGRGSTGCSHPAGSPATNGKRRWNTATLTLAFGPAVAVISPASGPAAAPTCTIGRSRWSARKRFWMLSNAISARARPGFASPASSWTYRGLKSGGGVVEVTTLPKPGQPMQSARWRARGLRGRNCARMGSRCRQRLGAVYGLPRPADLTTCLSLLTGPNRERRDSQSSIRRHVIWERSLVFASSRW